MLLLHRERTFLRVEYLLGFWYERTLNCFDEAINDVENINVQSPSDCSLCSILLYNYSLLFLTFPADMSTKVAVVTGSNKGIGLAIVKALCQQFEGVVYVTARDM